MSCRLGPQRDKQNSVTTEILTDDEDLSHKGIITIFLLDGQHSIWLQTQSNEQQRLLRFREARKKSLYVKSQAK